MSALGEVTLQDVSGTIEVPIADEATTATTWQCAVRGLGREGHKPQQHQEVMSWLLKGAKPSRARQATWQVNCGDHPPDS